MAGTLQIGNPQIGGVLQRHLGFARGDRLQQIVMATGLGEHGGSDQRGIGQRLGNARAAEFGCDQCGVEQREAKAALCFGNEQAGQAHFDKALPDGIGTAAFARIERAELLGAVDPGQIVAHGFGERQLVFGKREIHGRITSAGRADARR